MARQMKDSGIAWIGEIPEGWHTCKIKDIFQVFSGATPKSEQAEYWDGDIIWVTPADYKTTDKFVSCGKRTITQAGYDSCGTTLVPAGSIVFSKRAPIGSVAIAKVPLCTNQGCLSCINKGDADTIFFYYVMSIFTEIFELYGSGTTFKELSYDSFTAFAMTNPPLSEQHRIAAFLDRRCAEIDAVIERTKATIEEYKKLKQAVITEAVTKGVRGERKMKDSGIEWIGEIAEEHPIIKLKYVCQILDQYRSPVTADQRSQNGDVLYDYYGASGPIDKIDGYTIDGHVMLIGEDGANLRLRNLPLMYEVNGKAWINNHAHILKPDDGTEFYYLFFALEALDINPYITGSAQPKLSQENLKNILIPMPTLDEQREITAFIRKRCSALDTLIAKKTSLLTELETYKKSLIFEYVTGKKEVPACP